MNNSIKEKLEFKEDEIKVSYKLCIDFQKRFSDIELDDEISDDELRISELSDKFQTLWLDKLYDCYEEGTCAC